MLNCFAGGATSEKGHAFVRRHPFLIRMPRASFRSYNRGILLTRANTLQIDYSIEKTLDYGG